MSRFTSNKTSYVTINVLDVECFNEAFEEIIDTCPTIIVVARNVDQVTFDLVDMSGEELNDFDSLIAAMQDTATLEVEFAA